MFCRENPSTTSRRQKMLSRVHWILKHAFLPYRNKQTRFSLEKCVDCNGLFNKDVLEPSYNNLKFIVWNHSYFCTNLITGLINNFLLFFSKFFRNLRPSSSLLLTLGFPGGSVNKICIAGSSIPGSGRSPGERNGNPLQYSCLENPMDSGTWQAIVHGVTSVRHNLLTEPPPETGHLESFLSSNRRDLAVGWLQEKVLTRITI